jgi:hypothetical protein
MGSVSWVMRGVPSIGPASNQRWRWRRPASGTPRPPEVRKPTYLHSYADSRRAAVVRATLRIGPPVARRPGRAWRYVSTATSSLAPQRCAARSSSSSSTWRLDGSPPCSRMDQRTAARSRSSESMVSRSRMVPKRSGSAGARKPAGQAGKSGQLAAFIQQRIRDTYRRQRPAPLPCRTAKSPPPIAARTESIGPRSRTTPIMYVLTSATF